MLSGCATVETVATSSNTFAACRAADVGTTYYALHHGFAEINPIVKVLLAHGWVPYIAASIGAWYLIDHLNNPNVTLAANIVGCGAVVHNIGVLAN